MNHNAIVDQVFAQAFIEKLASYGIPIRTDQDFQEALQLSSYVLHKKAQDFQKQASAAQWSPLSPIRSTFENYFGVPQAQAQKMAHDHIVKTAAALYQNPAVYNAFLQAQIEQLQGAE